MTYFCIMQQGRGRHETGWQVHLNSQGVVAECTTRESAWAAVRLLCLDVTGPRQIYDAETGQHEYAFREVS